MMTAIDFNRIIRDIAKLDNVIKSLKFDLDKVDELFNAIKQNVMTQLEIAYFINDRQKEGIEIAKQEGKYKGRKPIDVDADKWEALYQKWEAEEITATAFMTKMGLKPNTFYRRLNEYRGDR